MNEFSDEEVFGNIAQTAPPSEAPSLRPFQPGERVENEDGSYSTERTVTVQTPEGKWTVVPSLWMDDTTKTPQDLAEQGDDYLAGLAADYESRTGQAFPKFDNLEEAEEWAVSRSSEGGASEVALTETNEDAPVELTDEEVFGEAASTEAPNELSDEDVFGQTIDGDEVVEDGLLDDQVIADKGMMSDIRQYMRTRKGEQYAERTDAEVYDDWKSHMRAVNSGEVSLVGEILATNRYEKTQKEVAGRAYEIWEQIAPMWDQGIGETGEAVFDYVANTLNPIESPSTLVSLGFGKALTSVTAKPLAMAALKTALKDGGRAGAMKAIRNHTLKQGLKAGAIGGLFDGAVAASTDVMYQTDVEMELGVRDEYNPLQTAAAGALGVALPAVTNAALAARAGSKGGVGITPTQAGNKRRFELRQSQNAVAGAIQARVAQAAKSMTPLDWQAAKVGGQGFDLRESDARVLTDTFFDHKDPNSIVNILHQAGVKIDFEEGKVANNVISYIDDLPDHLRLPIEQAWSNAVGVPYDEARDKLISVVSKAGEDFAHISLAKRKLSAAAANAIQQSRKPKPAELGTQTLGYIQNLWKRMLVSHPATTAVNVQGWAIADMTRLASNTVQTLYTLAYDPKQGSRMAMNLYDRGRMYSDLYGTKEMWDDVLQNVMPKWAKGELSRETFGGVAAKSPAEIYGVDNIMGRAGDKLADTAARWTFVNAQDNWTRAISGMMELERQVRLKHGMRYADLVKSGKEKLLMNDDELWDQVVQTSLKDTFSFDYSKGKGAFSQMARGVQSLSNAPGTGLIFPFGKFMANTVAFTARHSPLGAWNFGKHLMKKEGYDATKALSEATVGTVAFMMLGKYSYEKMQEGFDATQLETSTGDTMDRANLAPASQYLTGGRMWEMMQNGETPSADMWKEFGKQLAVGEFADLGNMEGVKAMKLLTEWMASPTEEAAVAKEEFTSQVAKMGGSILSGFTRPLEPLNVAAQIGNEASGLTKGPITVDRKLADGPKEQMFLQMVRYVDQVFAPFTEDGVVGEAARQAARPEGDILNPQPQAKMMGVALDHPMNWTNKALGQVGLPEFRIDSRTAVPEYDRMINELIAPRLNQRFKNLLGNPEFKKATMARKRATVQATISKVKEEAVTEIESRELGRDPEILNMRRKFTIAPDPEKKEALKAFDLEGVNPRELTYEQLKDLAEFMENRRGRYKEFLKHLE